MGIFIFTINQQKKSQFLLDPNITFVNHGSFGACPKPIFEEYQRFQLELDNEPVYFIQKKMSGYLKTAKDALAKYIDCGANDFFFIQTALYYWL